MILKIAIADTNEEYVKRILSVLEEYLGTGFDVAEVRCAAF